MQQGLDTHMFLRVQPEVRPASALLFAALGTRAGSHDLASTPRPHNPSRKPAQRHWCERWRPAPAASTVAGPRSSGQHRRPSLLSRQSCPRHQSCRVLPKDPPDCQQAAKCWRHTKTHCHPCKSTNTQPPVPNNFEQECLQRQNTPPPESSCRLRRCCRPIRCCQNFQCFRFLPMHHWHLFLQWRLCCRMHRCFRCCPWRRCFPVLPYYRLLQRIGRQTLPSHQNRRSQPLPCFLGLQWTHYCRYCQCCRALQ